MKRIKFVGLDVHAETRLCGFDPRISECQKLASTSPPQSNQKYLAPGSRVYVQLARTFRFVT